LLDGTIQRELLRDRWAPRDLRDARSRRPAR